MNNTFSRNAKNALYQTTNSQYGTKWVQDDMRPQLTDIKTAKVPTYAEIVESMNNFKKSERLIKSKLVQQKLEAEGIDPNSENHKFMKKTEFPIRSGSSYKYPHHGLKVGSPIYRTNNMNYGSNVPADFQLQEKYFPTNHTFSKSFCGGNFRFNGLNTTKTVSGIHDALNEM